MELKDINFKPMLKCAKCGSQKFHNVYAPLDLEKSIFRVFISCYVCESDPTPAYKALDGWENLLFNRVDEP